MDLRSLMFWRRPDRCAKCDEYEEAIAHLTSIDYKADGVHPTVANAAFDGAAVKLFAASAAHWFKETGGENFVTLDMSDPKTGDHYQLTMQKAGGITPAVKMGRLNDEIGLLRGQLDWMVKWAGVEWHGWWSQRIADTPEPLRTQMKGLLYPDGYPSEKRHHSAGAEHGKTD